jgi:hypothetical protein
MWVAAALVTTVLSGDVPRDIDVCCVDSPFGCGGPTDPVEIQRRMLETEAAEAAEVLQQRRAGGARLVRTRERSADVPIAALLLLFSSTVLLSLHRAGGSEPPTG